MLLGTFASAYVNQQNPIPQKIISYNLTCGFQYFQDEALTKAQIQACARPKELVPIEFDVNDYIALANGTRKAITAKVNGNYVFLDRAVTVLNSAPTTINPCIVHHNYQKVRAVLSKPVTVKVVKDDESDLYRLYKWFLGRPQSEPVKATPIPEPPLNCVAYNSQHYDKPEATRDFAAQILQAEKSGGINGKFDKFMELYAPLALFAEKESGISARTFIVQIGIESNWGTYQPAVELNNVGGLGHTWCESARANAVSETGKPLFNGPLAYGGDAIPLECGGRSEAGQTYFKFANIEDYVRMWMHTYFLSKDHRGIDSRMQVCLAYLKENKSNASLTSASLQGYASAPGYIANINSEIINKKSFLDKYLSQPLCLN